MEWIKFIVAFLALMKNRVLEPTNVERATAQTFIPFSKQMTESHGRETICSTLQPKLNSIHKAEQLHFFKDSMLQKVQNEYEETIEAAFNQLAFGLNPSARIMLEKVRGEVTQIADALQVAYGTIIEDLYGRHKDNVSQLKIDLMAKCTKAENICIGITARISTNMVNAITHQNYEPMALDFQSVSAAITPAIRGHEQEKGSADLKQLFAIGAKAAQNFLHKNYVSIAVQYEASRDMVEAYCKQFLTDDKHDIKHKCQPAHFPPDTVKDTIARLQKYDINAINDLTRANLVVKIYDILNVAFKSMQDTMKSVFAEHYRVIYYLIH